MRFARLEHHAYEATARKSAAILRRQKRERDALPLFADLVASEQLPVDVEHEQRRQRWESYHLQERARRVRDWRRARSELRNFPSPERERLTWYWNHHRWFPAVPSYLLSALHMYREGRLNLDAPGMTQPRASRSVSETDDA